MRIFACMASSLDGKIGPAGVDRFVPITSAHDLEHLKSRRDEADGILFGAQTFRTWPKVHQGHDPSRKPHHFILSRSLQLDAGTDLFKTPEIPITIFTDTRNLAGKPEFPERVRIITTPGGPRQIPFIIKRIKDLGVTALLVEGGGLVLHQFIAAKLLQELYLTVAPTIIGNSEAPGLLGGQTLESPPRMQLLASTQHGDETYLHLKFDY